MNKVNIVVGFLELVYTLAHVDTASTHSSHTMLTALCMLNSRPLFIVGTREFSLESRLANILISQAHLHLHKFIQEYKNLDISWHQRHLQMTPMFAATLASSSGQTQYDQSVGGTLGEGGVRATQQSLAFTPTQGTSMGRVANACCV